MEKLLTSPNSKSKDFHLTTRCSPMLLLILLATILSASLYAQRALPLFNDVAGTELTKTNGQWVRFDPAQPNNIDLVESRIFKMPKKGSGILGVEFKLVGGDGGTAWYKNLVDNRFANGGRGGDLYFTVNLKNNSDYYGKPFVLTFGKKGESVTYGKHFYVAGGGGGSTGMSWLFPGNSIVELNRKRHIPFGSSWPQGALIAAAGGGSGGFATYHRSVHGASAWYWGNAGEFLETAYKDNYFSLNWITKLGFSQLAGGSAMRTDNTGELNPPYCCTNELKKRNVQGVVHSEYDYDTQNGILTHITHGQSGGKPTVIWHNAEEIPIINGMGGGTSLNQPTQTTIANMGGRGGAGLAGGGAGVVTVTWAGFFNLEDEAALPTSGAGGTGSSGNVSKARSDLLPGQPGWNMNSALLENDGIVQHNSTPDPKSGYMMYRTIPDVTPPEIRMTEVTVHLGNGNTSPGNYQSYNPVVTFEKAIEPYLMKSDGIWDDDGIASVTATVNGQPFTQFECFMARSGAEPVPVNVTVTDGAGHRVAGLIIVTVTDPFVPVPTLERRSLEDWDRPFRIDVSNGPVALTTANFPVPYDGCKSPATVTTHFPATTFYCNDAGDYPVAYYYTDSDGNTSPTYTKTFKVQCNAPTSGNQRYVYVDQAATGANDGSSWANAFKSLRDALSVSRASGIYVAEGTYRPTTEKDRTAYFELGNNVKLYGGFPAGGADFVNRNPDAYPTILSGEIGNPATLTDNSYFVVKITGNNTQLEGFTIRDNTNDNPFLPAAGVRIEQEERASATDHKTVIRNCKFLNNECALSSFYTNESHANYLDIRNCLFENNPAMASVVFLSNHINASNTHYNLVNCVFNNNTSSLNWEHWAVLSVRSNPEVNITNCTFGNNTGSSTIINDATVRLHNSILWNNTSNPINNSGTFEVAYSNIQGSGGSSNWNLTGVQDLGHNIDADPLFAASPALSIHKGSPSANAGLNTYNTEPYDIYGNRRILMNTIDMGAFETENFTVFVAADAPSGGDGTSWARAFNNLHDGIAAAGFGAETKDVWVKAGIYRPDRIPGSNTITQGNRENSFWIRNFLKIYGGFAGTESSTMQRNIGRNPTILSGDIGLPGNAADNAYHVVTMVANVSRMDGFIIEGGNSDDKGGGVYQSEGVQNVVANCVFRNNHATDKGGAWYANGTHALTTDFVQCVFYGNTASRGAAAFLSSAYNSNSYDLNFYNATAFNNTSSTAGAGAFEAAQALSSSPAKLNFYNSLLAGNTPANYNDTGNPGNISLANTYATASGAAVFVNETNIAGADGKIMTADDGIRLNLSSPAINFGSETHLYTGAEHDITGSQRVINKIDAGAYESPYQLPLIADVNQIIYVMPTATGEGTGDSWDNATNDLHNAIHALNVKKVFVAAGTYQVGAHSFIMKNGVEIFGGFDPGNGITDLLHRRIMPNPANNAVKGTVLDGQLVRPVIWNIFSETNALNNTAVLDGIMLMNGKHPTGGGVRNIYASPTLRNVVISQNRAAVKGAGMYNDHSSPVLTNVIICNNGIDALFNPNGGQNIYGGGMYNTGASAPILTNVTLAANYLRTPVDGTTMTGAGIYNENSSLTIKNSILWQNRNAYNITMAGSDIANAGSGTVVIQQSITQEYDTNNPADNNLVKVDPEFENIGARDYRLLAISPAINAGSNQWYWDAVNGGVPLSSPLEESVTGRDITGKARVYDYAANKPIDMGAHEFQCVWVDYSGIAFESKTVVYNGNPHSIVVQNLPQEVTVTYEMRDRDWEIVEGLSATDAGIYTVTATMLPNGAAGDCEPYVLTATLTIQKAASIITTDEIQRFVYDGTAKSITANLSHTAASLIYSPQQEYTEVGVYPVTVSVPAVTNYAAASEMVNLVIENADFTGITLSNASFPHDGTPKSIAITGTLPSDASVIYNGNQKTDVGSYTVSALVQLRNYNDLWLNASMNITDPLPVELISFTVRRQEKTAVLNWTTVAEYNNRGFDVERSPDGRNWNGIGFMSGLSEGGSSSVSLVYRFTDETPLEGINYYRLKQLDMDGRYEYSPMKAVLFEIAAGIKAWPNPVNDRVTIELPPSYIGSKILIFSVSGIELQQLSVDGPTLTIELEKYPAGIYLLYTFDRKVVRLIKD